MPFGLKTALATLQMVMDTILLGQQLQHKIFLVYVDDIIVYSTSSQEHMVNLNRIFQPLRKSFQIQVDKIVYY